MPKTITVKGAGAMDEAQRAEALQFMQDKLTTNQLMKLKKLASQPEMVAMLNNF